MFSGGHSSRMYGELLQAVIGCTLDFPFSAILFRQSYMLHSQMFLIQDDFLDRNFIFNDDLYLKL